MGKYLNAVGAGTKDFFRTQWNAVTLSCVRSAVKRQNGQRSAWKYMSDDEREALVLFAVCRSIYRNLTPFGVIQSLGGGVKAGLRSLKLDKNREGDAIGSMQSRGISPAGARKVVASLRNGDLDFAGLETADQVILADMAEELKMEMGKMVNF